MATIIPNNGPPLGSNHAVAERWVIPRWVSITTIACGIILILTCAFYSTVIDYPQGLVEKNWLDHAITFMHENYSGSELWAGAIVNGILGPICLLGGIYLYRNFSPSSATAEVQSNLQPRVRIRQSDFLTEQFSSCDFAKYGITEDYLMKMEEDGCSIGEVPCLNVNEPIFLIILRRDGLFEFSCLMNADQLCDCLIKITEKYKLSEPGLEQLLSIALSDANGWFPYVDGQDHTFESNTQGMANNSYRVIISNDKKKNSIIVNLNGAFRISTRYSDNGLNVDLPRLQKIFGLFSLTFAGCIYTPNDAHPAPQPQPQPQPSSAHQMDIPATVLPWWLAEFSENYSDLSIPEEEVDACRLSLCQGRFHIYQYRDANGHWDGSGCYAVKWQGRLLFYKAKNFEEGCVIKAKLRTNGMSESNAWTGGWTGGPGFNVFDQSFKDKEIIRKYADELPMDHYRAFKDKGDIVCVVNDHGSRFWLRTSKNKWNEIELLVKEFLILYTPPSPHPQHETFLAEHAERQTAWANHIKVVQANWAALMRNRTY